MSEPGASQAAAAMDLDPSSHAWSGPSPDPSSDPSSLPSGRWAVYAGLLTLMFATVFLAIWLGGGPAGAARMGPLTKTNSVVCLLLLSLSLVIQALVPTW